MIILAHLLMPHGIMSQMDSLEQRDKAISRALSVHFQAASWHNLSPPFLPK